MKTFSLQMVLVAAAMGAVAPRVALAQPVGYASQPVGYGSQPVGYGSPPSEYGAQLAGGYVQPSFSGPTPVYPASPLAGGPTAVQGGAYMDAAGNPIVMPAQFCQDCYVGAGGPGGCPCGPGGMGGGDGSNYADFGGFGMEQCGPHYFDLSVEAVFLAEDELLAGSGPFASVGAGNAAPRVLDPSSAGGDHEAGWQISGRYDIGPLSVFEGTYMGLYDIGFSESVNSVDVTNPSQDFQLFSTFSNFGVPSPLPGVDDGRRYTLGYDAQLESAELSYRRYWVGHRPRFSGTWLAGFRYVKFDEALTFNTLSLVNQVNLASSSRSWNARNDLLGFQIGGDGWLCLRQGLRLGGEAKGGVYNNSYKFRHVGAFPDGVQGAPGDFDVSLRDDHAAFVGESGVTLVADILPTISLRGGYRVLYLSSLAGAGGSVDPTNIGSTRVADQAYALFHGFSGGIECVW